MTEDIRISPDGTYILVTSTGQPSLDEMKQTLSKLSELQIEHGIYKMLIDARARSTQPAAGDIYRGGELIAKTLGPRTRIAVLVGRVDDNHRLFEDVAVNRGASVAFFQHERLALSWLLENDF